MKLYLITDENQEQLYVVAESMTKVEAYYEKENLPTLEEIKMIDDVIIIVP